ncbi:structural maintenance of chromosomes protein 5 [Stemphylium lycopersici]|nr:structural maintenance of chromosomes protein 5 [Stemphylium lycopersici]
MPGLVRRGRKRPSLAISEPPDEQSDDSSTSSSKRARHGRDASDSPARTHGHANGTSAYAEDDFQPGSLVRVKLRNFVTYTAAEFHLGPSLNMVIGPNGTGKSTLVCAICLGLGWGSEHLGRAKDMGAFVKHGATEAVIEIELATGSGNGRNRIVQRTIRKSDNKSVFLLDGQRASQSAVVTMARQYSIQIDNLCQFLPQDRVVEFAKMSDVDRLRETQRAAAPPHMVEWHDQLKALRSEERDLKTKEESERNHLAKLDKQQNATRDDVKRFHEREGLLRKSRCLKKVRPIIETKLLKNDVNRVKEEKRLALIELDQIKEEMEPARQALAEVETYRDEIEGVVKLRKNRIDMIKIQADKLMKNVETDRAKATDFTAQIKAETNSKKTREKDIVRVKADISRLEQRRQNAPVEYDAQSYERRKGEVRAQYSSIANTITEKKNLVNGLRTRAIAVADEHRGLQAQLDHLNTQSGKQASLLQKVSGDTAKAWEWIQKNKHTLNLSGEVVGPPILECSIPEAKYAQAVEGQLRRGDVVAITCTNSDDQKLLSSRLLSKPANGGLGLHDVHLRTSPKSLDSYKSPMPAADLAQYGFQGYMLDYIEGPDVVLAMLCDNSRLHQIACALDGITDEQHNAVSTSPLRTWVSGEETFRVVTRREYGASSTSVTKLKAAAWFTDQPANTEEVRKLETGMNELVKEKEELKDNHKLVADEIAKLKDEQEKLKQERDEIQADQDRTKKALAEWDALPEKIASKQTELDNYIQQNTETSTRVREIKAQARETSLHVAALTLEYAKVVTQMRTFHESLIEAEIRLIEAKSELNALKNENSTMLQRQQAKEAEITELGNRSKRLRDEYAKKAAAAQQDIESLTKEERDLVLEYRDLPSFDALEEEASIVTAKLEMMAEGNPGAIRAYEKREEDMVRTQKRLEQYMASLEETGGKITEIREQWEPQLDELISKISNAFAHNFQQIGCAGEVAVYKDQEDFDNWSIQISVRFRENEPLSVLNSHRQSGGERAVSTIFYLMALQDLAQSPFRVVDEINQGMDPRNERMVHERMVDIACQERTSQYFLVTPKLLTGLKFHPKMKVHVINSGEHIPDSKNVKEGWDLHHMAKIALRTRKGVAVA